MKRICTFLLIILYSCHQSKNAKFQRSEISDEKEFRYYEDSSLSRWKGKKSRFQMDSADSELYAMLFASNFASIMQLPQITEGVEGLYIRIWIWGFKNKFVINLKRGSDGTSCDVSEFGSKKKDSNYYVVVHKQWKGLEPRFGWGNFFTAITNFKIINLKGGPSFQNLQKGLTQMSSIQIEIAQTDCYRFYEYPEPAYYRYVDSNANNVYQFLKFFNDQMGVTVYDPNEKMFQKPH